MKKNVSPVRGERRRWFSMSIGAAAVEIFAMMAAVPAASAYDVVTVGNGGTIDGIVTLSGTAPAQVAVKVTKNQEYCGQSIPNPIYSVGNGGGLGNVIVYLKDITRGRAAPTDPAVLVNDHCMFNPRVQGAVAGTQITISNHDTVLHNTHPQIAETNATIYNVALPFKGFSVSKTLPAIPGLIRVKCDAHEWMRAWIMVLEHPYYATSNADGHFTIRDVPPGSYTLAVWHEAAGEKTEPVVVAAGQTVNPKITLAAK